jgi:bifunctional non-homologous end joining protein LigD
MMARTARRPVPPGQEYPPGTEGVAPMLATAGILPVDDDRWAFELKWDGMRAIAASAPSTEGTDDLVLWTRNGRNVADGYPELAPLGPLTGQLGAVLDGEIVAIDERGRPDFSRLQRRLQLSGERAHAAARTVPVVYLIFDLLAVEGQWLLDRPWHHRRQRLEELMALGLGPPASTAWMVPPVFDSGVDAMGVAVERGLEGVVAKRSDSPYLPGRRSPHWRKTVLAERSSFVVGGWRGGDGARQDTVSALLTGRFDDQGLLRYTGAVGSGLRATDLDFWQGEAQRLTTLTSPFSGRQPGGTARFMEPVHVIDVAFRELTPSGTLRHPTYGGVRPDLDPDDIVGAGE